MKKVLVAVYDSVADEFGAPVADVNTASAVRAFTHAIGQGDSNLAPVARDIVLFHIGYYDTVTGRIESFDSEIQLMRGADCMLARKEA
ncbi:MAG: nonstructural protein [Microviridae sp.]|nr:MAG: nonstructural protein [Microviridae sp.]